MNRTICLSRQTYFHSYGTPSRCKFMIQYSDVSKDQIAIFIVEELVHGRWQPTVQKSCSVWQFRISEPSNHCREWRDLTRINSFCHVVYLLICFLAFFSHAVMSGNLFCWKILRLSGVDSAVFFAIRSSIVI